jgi:F-type H+-transporting ATPase subunit b
VKLPRRISRSLPAVAGVALFASSGLALAQTPPSGLPQGHPAVPGMAQPTDNARPHPTVLPPRPIRRPRPAAPTPEPAHHEEEHAAHGGHCPGHGPNDPPPRINLYQGLLGVDNDKAVNGSAFEKVLFRYDNKDNACDPKNQPPPFLASLLNFCVLAFVIGKYGKKPLAEALLKRKESIMAEIDNATRLKEQSESRLAEYEEKFETIDETLAAAKSDYAAAAQQEKARILQEAETRRVRMRKDAEFRIEQELKAARILLLQEATENAASAAEELLRKRLTPADHERIAEDYLGSIAKALGPDGATSGRSGGAA